jgi:hypothetical protein
LLLWSVWAARLGSLRGLLLWAPTLLYVAYSYSYYGVDPPFNVLYLAYIGIASTACMAVCIC